MASEIEDIALFNMKMWIDKPWGVPGASKIAYLLGPDGEEIEIRDAGPQL